MKTKNVVVYDMNNIGDMPYTRVVFSSSNVWHKHTFFEFAVNPKGEYQNDIDCKKIMMKEGNVVLMRPEDVHNPHNFSEGHTHRDIYVTVEKMKAICDVFDPELFDRIMEKPLVINMQIKKTEMDGLINDLNIFNGYDQTGDDPMMERLHTAIVTYIIGLWVKKQCEREELPREIEDLLSKINSGEFIGNSIDEIADTTNYSHGYLCKIFKKHMGISLLEYVRDFKMNYSLSLLTNKELSIMEISNMLNYDVPSSFINAFKRKYGVSPREMRKKLLEKE